MSKKILTYLLILCMIIYVLPAGVLAASDTVSDERYESNVKFLKAIGSFSGVEYEYDRILTREELAELLVCSVGRADAVSGEDEAVIDTSFLNEKGWLWIADREQEGISLTQTEYSDVTTDMDMWKYIKLAAELGVMKGEDEKFRPHEDIVLEDMLYAVGRLLNFNIVKNSDAVEDMMPEIYNADILDGVSERDLKAHIRMSDIAMIMANTMKAQPYVCQFSGTGLSYKLEKNFYLMTHLFGICYARGVVTANNWAALPDYTRTAEGYIKVEDTVYAIKDDTDELLGNKYEVYFTDEDEYSIVYYEKIKSNADSVIVKAEDIINYSNHILTYEDENSIKKVTIPARAAVVYNGVQLDDYNDNVFNLISGQIELMIESSSECNLVKITKYETMILSSIDYTNEILYAEQGDITVLATMEYPDTEIFLANGTEVVFSTLSIDNVISVLRTLDGKQDKRLKIVVSTETVSGKITALNSEDEIVTLDGVEYQFLKGYYAAANLSVQKSVMLYLNAEGKAVRMKGVAEGGAHYGWLRRIRYNEDDDSYRLRIFESNDKFKNYDVADKLRFNGRNLKLENIFAQLTDDYESTIPQVIQYWTNESGNIVEICTADGTDGAFSKLDLSKVGVTTLRHKNGALLSQGNSGFAAFLNTTGGYVSFAIPLDEDDESKYGCMTTFSNDAELTFDELYLKSPDSKFIDVCVQKNVTATKVFNERAATPYTMISKVMQKIDEDDELYYSISGIDTTTNVEYKCYDTELFTQCAALGKGDVVRFIVNSMNKEIEFIEKAFDAEKRAMVSGETYDAIVLSKMYTAFNGFATTTTDNYQFLVTHKYAYDSTTKQPDMSATNAIYDKDKTMVFKYPTRIVCYDSSSGEVRLGSKQDIVYSENANKGTMVVVCSYYENAQIMFVIK